MVSFHNKAPNKYIILLAKNETKCNSNVYDSLTDNFMNNAIAVSTTLNKLVLLSTIKHAGEISLH